MKWLSSAFLAILLITTSPIAWAGKKSPGNDTQHNGDQSEGDRSQGNDQRGNGGPRDRQWQWNQQPRHRWYRSAPPQIFILPAPTPRRHLLYRDPWKAYDDCMEDYDDFEYCEQYTPED